MTAEEKEFISPNDLVRDSFGLAKIIHDSGFIPDVLVCLWRGGTPVGIVIHEYLLNKGVETNHIAIKAESYTGIGERGNTEVDNVDLFVNSLPQESRVLIIDDIYDTGYTLKKICEQFSRRTKSIKTATLFFKPGQHNEGAGPDFFYRKTDKWIVFPHEIVGLTPEELRKKDGYIQGL